MSNVAQERRDPQPQQQQNAPFGPTHILPPRKQHTNTIILLHGRGSSGPDFCHELFSASPVSTTAGRTAQSLQSALPTWRFVFPTARTVWSSTFREDGTSWFEMDSAAAGVDVCGGEQREGKESRESRERRGSEEDIRDAVTHILRIVKEEIALLGGRAERVVLGGISQGGALGLLVLLCLRQRELRRRYDKQGRRGCVVLGGFVGASTWLPLPFAAFAEQWGLAFEKGEEAAAAAAATVDSGQDEGLAVVMASSSSSSPSSSSSLAKPELPKEETNPLPPATTKVFMGHGTDDAYVDVELGRHAARVLTQQNGFNVQYKEYSGAEQEGHWLKAPEQIDDIYDFLCRLTFSFGTSQKD